MLNYFRNVQHTAFNSLQLTYFCNQGSMDAVKCLTVMFKVHKSSVCE